MENIVIGHIDQEDIYFYGDDYCTKEQYNAYATPGSSDEEKLQSIIEHVLDISTDDKEPF